MQRDQSSSVRQGQPVILGTGLTGLAISRALSSAGIAHVLAGDRPAETARLGESLDLEGSVEVARQFPDFSQFFRDKRRQALFYGEHAVSSDFIHYGAGPEFYRVLGYPPTIRLLHLDRAGFDPKLFDAVIASEHCKYLPGRATAFDYDPATDRIDGVRLSCDTTLASTYVFDATNYACVVARRLGVRRTRLGSPRRVVFAHYRVIARREAACARWLDATSLLRLDSRQDPVEGLAWCIPLGDYVSVGISVDPARTTAGAARLLDWVEQGLVHARRRRARRLSPTRHPGGSPLRTLQSRALFRAQLAAGGNQRLPVLVSLGLGGFHRPGRGPPRARRAEGAGSRPGRLSVLYIDRVATSHSALEWLVDLDPWSMTVDDLRRRVEGLIAGNVKRLSAYLGLLHTPGELAFGDALLRTFERGRHLANPLRIETAPLQAQATRLFAASGEPDPWMDPPMQVPGPARNRCRAPLRFSIWWTFWPDDAAGNLRPPS